ncbi:hypothetical protein N9Y92_03655 [Chlamydiales bacterium]|nr:hypothetical protein [Chlamydiales bacterium]
MNETTVLKHHFVGATLLIAGCCIGAGMLGLPLVTSLSGFFPSLVALVISWLFMLCTGLLLVEVYLYYKDQISLVSMAKRTTGNIGAFICWVTFLFLFYFLLVAYVSASGSIIVDFFSHYLEIKTPVIVPTFILTFFLGVVIFLGTESTDHINRFLMGGLIISYLVLVSVAIPYIDSENLTYVNWGEAAFILPTFVVSFGYHNLIPGISNYLKRNAKAIRWAVIIGSSIPFFVYIIWEWVLLGIIPVEGESGFREALRLGKLPSNLLHQVVGHSAVGTFSDLFSFFAITTSFLAVSLSLTDFLADGLKMPKTNKMNRMLLCLIVLIPPFIFGLSDPTLFIKALNHAGGICAIVLYGLLPCFMVWRGRYHFNEPTTPQVFGGKLMLILICLISCTIITLHLVHVLGGIS